jgi:hypothetical protein
MTRLQEQKMTPGGSVALNHRRNTDQVVIIPPELMVPETDFEQLSQELYPVHHDIRKRPR